LNISKNTHVIKFLDFKSCFNQLFISYVSSEILFHLANLLNNLFNIVIINQALNQFQVASHIKKLYLSVNSLNQNVSQDILSAESIFQNN
jgi:hypothetical protein